MKVVAIIPARYNSRRLPGKPLVSIAGKPMIQHVYQRTSGARSVDQVWVATDDERIKEVAEDFGAQVVMTSPTCPTGMDRVAEAVRGIEAHLVVNVQGDEPLVDPRAIDLLVEAILADDVPLGTLVTTTYQHNEVENPNVVKVVIDSRGDALYFSRSKIPFHQDGASGNVPYLKHVGIYAYRRQLLLLLSSLPPSPLEVAEGLEQLRALEHGYRIRVVAGDFASIGVDRPEDVQRVEKFLRGASTGEKTCESC